MHVNNLPKIQRKNKKAQVGETMTWIVATLIIVAVLLTFIYASVALAKAKSVKPSKIKSLVSSPMNKVNMTWVEAKNEMAFTRENSNRGRIEDWINAKQTS
jgi:hypothetical protein